MPDALARRNHILPLRLRGDTVVLVTGDPLNLRALDKVRAILE